MEQSDTNVYPQELDKFDNVASRWWDPGGEFKPLHDINPLRLDYIGERIGGFAGKRIVDIGCGGGLLSEAMAVRGADVLGIDLAPRSLEVARLHALETGVDIDYEVSSAEQLATQRPGQFDVVTCLEMLEHVPEPDAIVAACARLARPGATVIFSTLNRNPKAYLLAVVGAEYVLGLLPRGTHDYRQFIRPAELAGWARPHELNLRDLRGLAYNPLSRRYSLSNDVSVNYFAHFQRPQEAGSDTDAG